MAERMSEWDKAMARTAREGLERAARDFLEDFAKANRIRELLRSNEACIMFNAHYRRPAMPKSPTTDIVPQPDVVVDSKG